MELPKKPNSVKRRETLILKRKILLGNLEDVREGMSLVKVANEYSRTSIITYSFHFNCSVGIPGLYRLMKEFIFLPSGI